MDDLKKLMTYPQVATFFVVTPRTVRNWVQKGALVAVRTPSGQPRVALSSCIALEKVKPAETE